VCVALQRKFYPYHWFPVYPPAVALASIGLADWVPRVRHISAKALAAICLGVAFLVVTVRTPVQETWLTVRHIFNSVSTDDYYGSFFHAYNARDVLHISAYLRTHSKAGDRLFVWGHEATVIYLSGLSSATRFVFSLPLAAPGPFLEQYRSEAIHVLQSQRPRYIVTGAPFEVEDKAEFLQGFPELERILRSHYELVTRFGRLELFEMTRVPTQ
jgi:hypothetical protein